MSVESWKEEFYPIDAHEVEKEDAAKHSLQKWIGLRKVNLDKHNVRLEVTEVRNDTSRFQFSDDTCALCVYYYSPKIFSERKCGNCPITKILGKACDADYNSPWYLFADAGKIEPMISVLEKAVSAEGESK